MRVLEPQLTVDPDGFADLLEAGYVITPNRGGVKPGDEVRFREFAGGLGGLYSGREVRGLIRFARHFHEGLKAGYVLLIVDVDREGSL